MKRNSESLCLWKLKTFWILITLSYSHVVLPFGTMWIYFLMAKQNFKCSLKPNFYCFALHSPIDRHIWKYRIRDLFCITPLWNLHLVLVVFGYRHKVMESSGSYLELVTHCSTFSKRLEKVFFSFTDLQFDWSRLSSSHKTILSFKFDAVYFSLHFQLSWFLFYWLFGMNRIIQKIKLWWHIVRCPSSFKL